MPNTKDPLYLGGALNAQRPEPRPAKKYLPFDPDGRPCCDQAVPARCVCIARFVCPVHGDNCFGSHD
jgi:hypothetical protein